LESDRAADVGDVAERRRRDVRKRDLRGRDVYEDIVGLGEA